MPNYKYEQYIYHITAVENIPNILTSGLQCRNDLKSDDFNDVASHSILDKRAEYGLDKFVPFHWVYGSEFDYNIHETYDDTEFAYIAIDRNIAKNENWKVIPQHPLAGGNAPEILDYSIGFNKINWSYMKPHAYYSEFGYSYQNKQTTMAECLAPKSVPANKFAKIFVANEETLSYILDFFDEAPPDDEYYIPLSEHSNESQSVNDDPCDSSDIIVDIPSDLFEVRPDMFKYYQ